MCSISARSLRGLDNLLWGLAVGLAMGLAGLAAGSLIGIVAAWGAISRRAVGPDRSSALYVGLIRNVPILVLALFAFFALPQYGIRFSQHTTFAAVLAVYAGAYLDRVVPRRDRRDPERRPWKPPSRSG